MSMATGARLGPYKIEGPLGVGGMGEVYRASDPRLGRDVALKVLPESFLNDAERLARFTREAQVLAALNHPHIAAIYGVEQSEAHQCLVLEFVPGETLAERIANGPVPLTDALDLARQIADGLEAAHDRGIVHRDLKPANIKVTPEGTVKILDFGLAKALETEVSVVDLSRSPTLTTPATRLGVIMGTAAYMSPEQARGREVDRRADIWAFGCVLYEMLSGQKAFAGDTVSDIMASILKIDADIAAIPSSTPQAVRRLIARCLTRDPRQRLRDIGEARLVIEDVLAGRDATLPAAASGAGPSRALPLSALAAVALVAAILSGVAVWLLRPSPTPPAVRKLELGVEGLSTLVQPQISPDGRKIVYVANGRTWVRELDQFEAHELPLGPVPEGVGSARPASSLFWSPDSQWIGYHYDNKLWKVGAGGGAPTVISTSGEFGGGAGATWTASDDIIFSRGNTGLFIVPSRGGDLKPYLALEQSEQDMHQPYALPDNRGLIYVAHRRQGGPDTLMLYDGANRRILQQVQGGAIWDPSYSATGHIVFRRLGINPGIWALPFSAAKLEVTGDPFLVVSDGDVPSVASDGTLLCLRGLGTGNVRFVEVDRTGKVLRNIGQGQQWLGFPDLSPDGRSLAVASSENDNIDIWIHDLVRGTRTRLTFGGAPDTAPSWSPDGKQIAYTSLGNTRLALKAADGTGQEQDLTGGVFPRFSRDGKVLVYALSGSDSRSDIWYLPLEGERKPVQFINTPAQEDAPELSPDGRYLSYQSDESGRVEIYLTRFPSGEGKWQVSVSGGTFARWSRKGDRLYYRSGTGDFMEVEVDTSATLRLGAPRALFSLAEHGLLMEGAFRYSVNPDSKRFIMVQSTTEAQRVSRLTVIQNWFAEFQGKR